MKTYNVNCPSCGRLNKQLYLEETDGWVECDICRATFKVEMKKEDKVVPVYIVQKIRLMQLQ